MKCLNNECVHNPSGSECPFESIPSNCAIFIPESEPQTTAPVDSPASGSAGSAAVKRRKIKAAQPLELLQKRDASHPITDVAMDVYDHYGMGWTEAEDRAIRVEQFMTKRGWKIIPPNDKNQRMATPQN